MANVPMVVAVLHSDAEDKHYQIRNAAYGLEMQIDDEWEAELVLLAPHEYLHSVTVETGVTSEDTAICSAGVTDVPVKGGGEADVSAIRHERNNWLLVAGSRSKDSEAVVQAKLRAALGAGCRVVLCFSEVGSAQLAGRLAAVDAAALPQLVIAYTGPNAAAHPAVAKNALRTAQEALQSRFRAADGCRFLVGGEVTAERAAALVAIPNIAGVLLEEHAYGDFGEILAILGELGG